MDKKLYSYDEAAKAIGLASRSSIRSRIKALAERGKPLTVEGGDLYPIGKRRLITEAGLEKLREFEPQYPGKPVGAVSRLSHEMV